MLQIHGDVLQREAPDGIYDDGWSNGAVSVTVKPLRHMEGFVVEGLFPDWWPAESTIAVEVNGKAVFEQVASPGTFALICSAPLYAGGASTIVVRTSATAYDPARDRHLGAYVAGLIFREAHSLPFLCNVCGSQGTVDLEGSLDPEASLCGDCNANIRIRKLAHLVGDVLFSETLPLDQFPRDMQACGLGISDSPAFAAHMKRVLPKYTNTQFDKTFVKDGAPFLDITQPPANFGGTADFVTCSEVLEHVSPPVQRAFNGLYSLLRPGGALILTVPYTLDRTVEHFPDLYSWRIRNRGSERVLLNRTRNGEMQEISGLRFHGGGEDVLEMRVFGLPDLLAHLETAGFVDIRVRDEDVPAFGIFLKYDWGLPITARRPAKE